MDLRTSNSKPISPLPRKTSSLTKNQLVLCSFAEKLTLNPGKITELDYKSRKIKLSVKAAQIDEEKSLIAKFGEGATKSGATLKGIFEKAIGKKNKKDK